MTRSPRHDESGFTLIEILVSAFLVAAISVGVLKGLDVSSRTSAGNKSRGLAASLAQQDQERLRAMTATTLAGVNSSRTVNVCGNGSGGCIGYNVTSKADWVADTSSGSGQCTLSSARSYNLQITSTVQATQNGSKPVVEKSLVAAPPGTSGGGQGSLAVRIREVDGVTPVPNISVTLTPPSGPPQVTSTDANGCIVWDYLNSGSGYTVSFNDPNYWDPSGQHAVSRNVSVVGQRMTTQNFTYSPGDTVDFNFKAYTNGTAYAATADRVTIERSGFSNQYAGTSGTFASRVRIRNLAPSNAYYAYAGDCAGEKLTTFPGLWYPNLGNLVGGALWNVTVYLSGIKDVFSVAGTRNFVSQDSTPHVFFTQTAAGCPGTKLEGWASYGTGYLKGFGVPKGTYNICVQAYVPTKGWRRQTLNGQVIADMSTSGKDIAGSWDISGGDTVGQCP